MTGSPPPLPVREKGTYAPRPRDAATVIIWRRHQQRTEVLMGERHQGHKFMPQRYVFPGGRVDPYDARVRSATEMNPAVALQLARTTKKGRGRSISIAAVRETFEETGLMIGTEDRFPGREPPRGWECFFETGLAPALDRLVYIARAITPPFRPMRFDARFFAVRSSDVVGELGGSGELRNLDWIPIRETGDYELPLVTRRVLAYTDELLSRPLPQAPERKIPYFKLTRDGAHVLVGQ